MAGPTAILLYPEKACLMFCSLFCFKENLNLIRSTRSDKAVWRSEVIYESGIYRHREYR